MGLYGAISSGLRKVGVFPEETGIDSPMWDEKNPDYDRLFGSDIVNSINPPDLFSAIDEPLARAEQIAKAREEKEIIEIEKSQRLERAKKAKSAVNNAIPNSAKWLEDL